MKRAILHSAVGFLVLCSMLSAAVPQVINFQGILKGSGGTPVADGSYSIVFTIYDAASGGNNLWSETQSVNTTNGIFNICLGSVNPIAAAVFDDSSRYLGIKVGSDPEMTPREKISSVGFSYNASQWTSASGNLYRLNGNVGIGTSSPSAKLDVGSTLLVDPANRFVGVNRLNRVTNSEYFGIYAPEQSGSYGGMYVGTGIGGIPFYGYISPTGSILDQTAWTYLDNGDWKLSVANTDRVTVTENGKVGIGTTTPAAALQVANGDVIVGDVPHALGASDNLYLANNTGDAYNSFRIDAYNNSIYIVGHSETGATSGTAIYFRTAGAGGGEADRLKINESGELEIFGDVILTGRIIGSQEWTGFPFNSGYGNVGGVWQNAQFRKVSDIVYLRGTVKKLDGSSIGSHLIGTLPAGFRPPKDLLFSTDNGYFLNVQSNGDIYTSNSNGFSTQAIDGVFFSTSL